MKRSKNRVRLYYELMLKVMKRSPGLIIMTKPDPVMTKSDPNLLRVYFGC